ncbi:hypothetical protein [Mycobacterium asiaticum]|uniref:hypothetical protein n=1 Tax=Mycobacterium asiaticum TaxID=1790 RepID=UPI0007F0115E|nr:hypothetical protein [Mycobacterium asiaticum]OBJ52429.1 hypothetical protein A9W94_24790 [Mycobacterium asiaticum]
MAKRQISEHFAIDFGFDNPAWEEMRNSPGVDEYLERVGEQTVAACNADLAAAQAKRKQPVEEGYDFHITHGTRSRLNIFPTTPRAMAHEAVNQSILKNVPVGTPAGKVSGPDHDIPRELRARRDDTETARDEATGRFTRSDES